MAVFLTRVALSCRQPNATATIDNMKAEIATRGGDIDLIFHTGDLSYADGYLYKYENLLNELDPIASGIPYMTGEKPGGLPLETQLEGRTGEVG